MKTLSNLLSAAESNANIERKRARLAELVRMAAEGQSLADQICPTTMVNFREFVDEQRDLRKIGSPKLLNRKHAPARLTLIDEIEGNLAKLAAYKAAGRVLSKKPSLSIQLDRLKAERDDLKYLVSRLVSQVAALLDENHKLRTTERASEKAKQLTSETIKELNKKVVKLGGTLLKGVKTDE